MEHTGADILDINMGCPMGKIVNNGDGAALMKDPELAGRIVEAVVKALPACRSRPSFAGAGIWVTATVWSLLRLWSRREPPP